MTAPTITPWLWFSKDALEAAEYYVSVFPDSRIERVTHYPADCPGGPAESVATVEFTLAGRHISAFNGGGGNPFTPAISLSFECDGQDELDRIWDALLADGGRAVQCGWLTDRYGLSWQITPRALVAMMGDPDRAAAARAMTAMMGMVKLDLAALERAHRGEAA